PLLDAFLLTLLSLLGLLLLLALLTLLLCGGLALLLFTARPGLAAREHASTDEHGQGDVARCLGHGVVPFLGTLPQLHARGWAPAAPRAPSVGRASGDAGSGSRCRPCREMWRPVPWAR